MQLKLRANGSSYMQDVNIAIQNGKAPPKRKIKWAIKFSFSAL
jgi:hypothetical protein